MTQKKVYIGILILIVWAGGLVWLAVSGKSINVKGEDKPAQATATATPTPTPVACSQNARPFAVMLSSDKEARPLSGISQADIVFEMPVLDIGFTRIMAVYKCAYPKEVGSIRSSRMDFVP